MPLPSLDHLLGKVRQLNDTIRAGGPAAIPAFRELTNLLLNLTILAPGGTIKLVRLSDERTKAVLGGLNPRDPLKLSDGRYLRVSAKLYLDLSTQQHYLKVEETSYQYQLDQEGKQWIFRYDYLRNPPATHPAAHLQIRGELTEEEAFGNLALSRVHFPTGRVSIEGVIRLLAEQFGVPCNQTPEIWRKVLALSEQDFLRVAHQPQSGPAE